MTSSPSPTADRAEALRALAVLCERPGPGHADIAAALGLAGPDAADHTELFVHQLPPYASIYLDDTGKIGGEARNRIAGFWRAVGLAPPAEPDHLAALLGLWASLVEASVDLGRERQALAEHSHAALVWEHLAPWLTPYLVRLGEIASTPYRAWSGLVEEAVDHAVDGNEVSETLPTHMHRPQTAVTGPADLVPFLLSPIRSGVVITRSDLHRLASELGMGLRIGERSYALSSLLDQGPTSVLEWMSEEAARQADALTLAGPRRTIADLWRARAETTASTLQRLARES